MKSLILQCGNEDLTAQSVRRGLYARKKKGGVYAVTGVLPPLAK